MSKQVSSNGPEHARVPLLKMPVTFIHLPKEKRNVQEMQASEFDAWALTFYEEIDNVKRDIWDVFARHRFINQQIADGDLLAQEQVDGTILLVRAEVKSSASEPQTEDFTSESSTEVA